MSQSRLIRIFLFIAIPLILLSISSSWIFEWMWLKQVGYSEIFWTLRGTQVILTIGAFLIAATYFTLNFRYLAGQLRYVNLGGTPLQNININFSSDFTHKRMRQIFTIAGLVIALMFAFSFYLRWDESLRFISSVDYGEVDPLFGNDISFYMFDLPFLNVLQGSLTSIAFLTLVILVLTYVFTGLFRIQSFTKFDARDKVLNHIAVNTGIWLLLLSWGFYLERYELLFKADGIVFGAGYTDVMIQLPSIWILFILALILSLIFFLNRWIKLTKFIPYILVLFVVVMILGRVLIPNVVQQFSVEPNELELESPYLEKNIQMTRLAYNLDDVEEVEYLADDTLGITDIRNNQDAIDNIRLWDPRLLIGTYKQLQEIRSYYEFYSVDNDRYVVDGQVTQMMLSAREISPNLPGQSD
ncbi:MAG: UPF0182 family protein, partial [Balneolaceae bacterium]|nr:UPF0182 family protein [Balneolaceae bacterium]